MSEIIPDESEFIDPAIAEQLLDCLQKALPFVTDPLLRYDIEQAIENAENEGL